MRADWTNFNRGQHALLHRIWCQCPRACWWYSRRTNDICRGQLDSHLTDCGARNSTKDMAAEAGEQPSNDEEKDSDLIESIVILHVPVGQHVEAHRYNHQNANRI